MRRATRLRLTLFLTVMAWMLVIAPAHAYIDPASSSFLLSGLVAGIAAAGTGLAMFWQRIVSFFKRDKGAGATSETSERSPEQV